MPVSWVVVQINNLTHIKALMTLFAQTVIQVLAITVHGLESPERDAEENTKLGQSYSRDCQSRCGAHGKHFSA